MAKSGPPGPVPVSAQVWLSSSDCGCASVKVCSCESVGGTACVSLGKVSVPVCMLEWSSEHRKV